MNNLNDPPRWNIQPEPRDGRVGGGDGNQWNYALLVPMLGLAAFRWIWTRESQREVQNVKVQYEGKMSSVRAEAEAKYREPLAEVRRSAALLELQLEKEKQKVEGYKHAMFSQRQRLMEERKQLQKERDAVEQEKCRMVQSSVAGAVLHDALEREEAAHQWAEAALKELEEGLVQRQNAYCSLVQPRARRIEMEHNMLLRAAKRPLGGAVDLERDLKDIFRKDKRCADVMNTDSRRNGSLMWVYLKYWQLQVTVEKQRRAQEAVLSGKIRPRVE